METIELCGGPNDGEIWTVEKGFSEFRFTRPGPIMADQAGPVVQPRRFRYTRTDRRSAGGLRVYQYDPEHL